MTNYVVLGYLFKVQRGLDELLRGLNREEDSTDSVNRVITRNTLNQMKEFIDLSIRILNKGL